MIQILIPSGFAVMSCDTFTASREKRETRLFLKSGCKGSTFFSNTQIFCKKSVIFVKNWQFMSCKNCKQREYVVKIIEKETKDKRQKQAMDFLGQPLKTIKNYYNEQDLFTN